MPNTGPSYTSISDYLNANQGTVANEAATVGGGVTSQLDAAKAADDKALSGTPSTPGDFTTTPGYADANTQQVAATQAAQGLSTPSGLTGLLQGDYHGGANYNQDQANWDGQLLGASNQSSFAPIEAQGKTLSTYLGSGAKPVAAPKVIPKITTPLDASGDLPDDPDAVPPIPKKPLWGTSAGGKFGGL